MCEALNDKKHARTADILESATYADAAVVFLQESSAAFATYAGGRALGDRYTIHSPGNASPARDQNSLVLLARDGSWSAIEDVSKGVADRVAADAAPAKSPVAPGDVAAFLATRGGAQYLLASFHGDTNGLATKPVLAALHAYRAAAHPSAKLLFGLDANVYAHESPKSAYVGDFAAQFRGLGMSSCYGSEPDPRGYTTFNARTYLQPQLNKAVRAEDTATSPLVDRNPKDFVLFYAADFKATNVAKDNTGTGAYDGAIVFPTLQFPSDHAITRTTLELL